MALMQKHLSRREMMRRIEQGRDAMKALAAAVVAAGGTLRIPRDILEGLPKNHKLEAERDAFTGDLILRADTSHRQAGLSFKEIRERYGAEGEDKRPRGADAAGLTVGHPDGQPVAKRPLEGGASSEPAGAPERV